MSERVSSDIQKWIDAGDRPDEWKMKEWVHILRSQQAEPVAWRVHRDVEYESREYFHTEADAQANATLGVCDTHITPLFTRPPAAQWVSGESLSLAWKRYVEIFDEKPHGTERQMAALLELLPSAPKEKPCANE